MSLSAEEKLNDVRDGFDDKHLQDCLEHVAGTLGISNPKYRLTPGSKKGDNYVGIIHRVFIEGEKHDGQVEIPTIMKVAPKDEFLRQITHVPYVFSREHFIYTEIVPMFAEFLKSKNSSFEHFPKCYFASAIEEKEVICLEDLRAKGFILMNGVHQLDFAHASLAFRVLGRFHAVSFALRDQRPELFESKITTLKETSFRPEVCADPQFSSQCELLGNGVKTTLVEDDPKYTERFCEFLKDAPTQLAGSCDGTGAEPYAVLCHGDYRVNNLLFKYEEGSTEPQDIYLLDFQLARYASPAVDISYVMFCNCSQGLRDKHFDELIRIYHESLSAYLSELGSDSKKLFPYEALLSQMAKFSVYGAALAMMVMPFFIHQDDDVLDLKEAYNSAIDIQPRIHKDQFLRNTLRDTYKDLIDRNYI